MFGSVIQMDPGRLVRPALFTRRRVTVLHLASRRHATTKMDDEEVPYLCKSFIFICLNLPLEYEAPHSLLINNHDKTIYGCQHCTSNTCSTHMTLCTTLPTKLRVKTLHTEENDLTFLLKL